MTRRKKPDLAAKLQRKRMPPQHLHPLPTTPGRYFWTEWNAVVDVHRVPGSHKKLFVIPPGAGAGIPVVISEFIAGDFTRPT